MDDFAQGAALSGTQKALTTISSSVQPDRLTSGAANSGGVQSGQKLLGSSDKGRRDPSSSKTDQGAGMDTTLQATTDLGRGRPEPEDD